MSSEEKHENPEGICKNKLNHLAVVLDGNRRFAKEQNMPNFKGHEAGAEKLEEFLRWCINMDIREVTVYALSTENLKRSKLELDYLFLLFKRFFNKLKKDKEIHEKKVGIRFIGDLSLIPEDLRKLAEEIEHDTKDYENYKINICLAYGGRHELIKAINKLIKSGKKSVTEEDITNALWLKTSPDLIIRTGNSIRTSNFLIWQSAYSEWIFLEKKWPEFTKEDLIKCIEKFKGIKRNFGV